MTDSSASRADGDTECLPGPLAISVVFPGIPAVISAVRSVVADASAGSPRAEDIVMIASEYATNAILHSPSGLPGGEFIVMLWVKPGWARIEVHDAGVGDWAAAPCDPDADGGRGLIIAEALADVCSHERGCAWAEVTWPPPMSA
jgi:anti-sigma regulatory factor (Ser/Thr protein kinase)